MITGDIDDYVGSVTSSWAKGVLLMHRLCIDL